MACTRIMAKGWLKTELDPTHTMQQFALGTELQRNQNDVDRQENAVSVVAQASRPQGKLLVWKWPE